MQTIFGKLALGAHDVCGGKVALGDGDDHGAAGFFRVSDGFLGLWHDAIIGCNDEHDDVCHISTAGAHVRENGVTWGIQERDWLAIVENLISTDVLSDTAGLA